MAQGEADFTRSTRAVTVPQRNPVGVGANDAGEDFISVEGEILEIKEISAPKLEAARTGRELFSVPGTRTDVPPRAQVSGR